jgi:hypothetical protein
LNLGMPHELHQRRQTDAATEHVGREGVPAMPHAA